MTGESSLPTHDQRFLATLRHLVSQWADAESASCHRERRVVLQAPAVFGLLCRASLAPEAGPAHRYALFSAMVYFKDGLDLVPEATHGAAGLLDDLAVAAFALTSCLEDPDTEPVCAAMWEGDGALSDYLAEVLDLATESLGRSRMRTLRRLVV